MAMQTGNSLQRTPNPSGLYDVLDLILDKGLVVDLYVRVSLVGIELLTIDARIVVASVDTYLRFAEAVNRLDISENNGKALPEFIDDMRHGGARAKAGGALEGVKDKVSEVFGGDDDDDADGDNGKRERQPVRRKRPRNDRDGDEDA
jgi:hypothetical protein